MILPDVNVLVYAYRREAERHGTYAAWIADVVGGSEELAHSWPRSHGARLATADRGIARFPGLDWFDPAPGRPPA